MHAIAVLLVLAAVPQTQLSKQSRDFFSKVIDFKLKGGMLTVEPEAKGDSRSALYQMAYNSFPGAARLYVQSQHGSTSRAGGSGPSIDIRLEPDGVAGSYRFELQAPGSTEFVLLEQKSPGQLTLEIRKSGLKASYAQSKGSCVLKVRTSEESHTARGRTFPEALGDCPDNLQRAFIEAVEAYFDKVPFVTVSNAPPGKALLRLRDGSVVVGEIRLEALTVRTAYGVLSIPRDELAQIVFRESDGSAPGPESVVVAKRFSPRGTIELESFEVVAPYGALRIAVSDVREVVFGRPLEEPKPGS